MKQHSNTDEHPMDQPAGYPLTEGLARFAAEPPPMPPQALATARDGITDAIGLLVAARQEAVVQAALRHAVQGQPQGSSSVLLSGQRTRARDAAFVNAVAAHAFAMDDVAWGCHPSAVLMPALLAAGEQAGATGGDLLRGWVVGYEVLAELATREPGSWHTTGWHPTGVIAPVAVAAAVCHVMRLAPDASRRALGIAASCTGGLQANFGTQTKALHAGRVAAAGVEAAELAALGVTASPHALEHAQGLLQVVSPTRQADVGRPFDHRRPAWRSAGSGIAIKKYPLCYSVHRIADAAIDLAARPGFDAARVAGIEVWIGTRQAAMAHHLQPATDLEARYSVPFAVATGLLAGAAGFAQLVPAFYGSDAVRRLIAATRVHLVDGVSPDDPVFAPADRVRVTLADGSQLDSGEVRFARGHPQLPIASEQLRAKFMDCAASLGEQRAAWLFGTLQALEQLRDLRELIAE
ncbi:MAG TPA: MmgE/PrpD family protein [Ramlibacter sp.]|nr:MmgE/PrpD family protein [Ramlibacter sp.]